MSVLFLFIDGLGIGPAVDENPLHIFRMDAFNHLTGDQGLTQKSDRVINEGLFFSPVDANLGVDGLPQSGTGQASLFSGENAPKILGRHFGPFAHSKIKFLLKQQSIFHKCAELGYTTHFINAYPQIFFDRSKKHNRWSCTTLMAQSAKQRLNTMDDILEGKAITAEITQKAWREMLKLDVPEITAEDAAGRLVSAGRKYDLVLYEYYLTDKAGHAMDLNFAIDVLTVLGEFLNHVLEKMDPDMHLVISSDHGNIEDMSVKTHTRNPVPLIVTGKKSSVIQNPSSIMDVPGVILDLIGKD